VLFSHPADFTPVCTTEFTAFAKRYPDFQAMNTELLGLSIDSYYSHVAWVRNIKEKFGVEIPFPIIEDLSMKVARAYGMIHPGAADTPAVRTTWATRAALPKYLAPAAATTYFNSRRFLGAAFAAIGINHQTVTYNRLELFAVCTYHGTHDETRQ
jgi:hypothetical protein